MSSPFAIFRKHQKLLTVILTGMAMFAFVILGAVPDPSNMPPALTVLFLAGALGGIAWIAGIRANKSNEWGLVGVAVGAFIGIAASLASGPPLRVKADTGNIDEREFDNLQRQRAVANQFLAQLVFTIRQRDPQAFLMQPQPFRFHYDPERDIVVTELLNREADRLGIIVSDATISDFLMNVTQQKVTAADVKTVRDAMGIGESDVYEILRGELKARLAAEQLYGGTSLAPASYWDFYRQLNVRASTGIVPVPVSAFVDEQAAPTESELQQLFDRYRDNFPNMGADEFVEEGRPGFRQPRKVQLAYVEAAFEEVERTVPPVTDEDIQAHYDQYYKSVPADAPSAPGGSTGEAPALPPLSPGAPPAPGDASTPGSTPAPATPPAPGTPPASGADNADEPPEAGRIDADDLPRGEAGEPSVIPQEGSALPQEGSAIGRRLPWQLVAYADEPAQATQAPPADAPGSGTATLAADEKANDGKTDTPPEAPAESTAAPAADATPGETPASSTRPPAPPLPDAAAPHSAGTGTEPPDRPGPPPLDDELRSEIRDQVLRDRTRDRLEALINETYQFMQDLALQMSNPPDDPQYLKEEAAEERLRQFAESKGLSYAKTPLLSPGELRSSEDFPIGRAVDRPFAEPFSMQPVSDVVTQAFTTSPTQLLQPVRVVDPETESRFVYWKTADVAEYRPEDLSRPEIRQQVLDTWRSLQARERARKRAEELSRLADDPAKPLSEVFAGQTVTGAADSPAVSVLHPAPFAWLKTADPRLSPNPWDRPAPELSELPAVPGRIGDRFMETVFDELAPGEAGVAHSFDTDYYYVVRVDAHNLADAPDLQAFRERFLREPLFDAAQWSDYGKLALNELRQYQSDWSEELFRRHQVTIVDREAPPTEAQEADVEPMEGGIPY